MATRFYNDSTRSILTRNNSPDVGFDASVNPYRGCEHGCIYCYARPTPVNMSGVTDCYQPAERVFRVTRGCVEVLNEFRNPFTIITKNHLVTRDLEIFKEMAERKAMGVFLSVTSLDTSLIEELELSTRHFRRPDPDGQMSLFGD